MALPWAGSTTLYRYEVYVPRDYDAGRAWPIVLALHGGSEYGSDGVRPTVGALAKALRLHPDRFPAIVVFPQAHADGTPGWQRDGGEAALLAVDQAVAEFHGDSSRIYLTGYSAGGNGAWFLAYHHPQRFAALVVICGFVSDFTGRQSHVFYPGIAPASALDRKHPDAKPWKGLGPGVFEVVSDYMTDTFRAGYVVRFEQAIYVLHCFQKKSPTGTRTAKTDVEMIECRLKVAKADYEVRYGQASQKRQ
jgi:acetyl esterase/lipase